jgi:hypothetical protein
MNTEQNGTCHETAWQYHRHSSTRMEPLGPDAPQRVTGSTTPKTKTSNQPGHQHDPIDGWHMLTALRDNEICIEASQESQNQSARQYGLPAQDNSTTYLQIRNRASDAHNSTRQCKAYYVSDAEAGGVGDSAPRQKGNHAGRKEG